MSVENSKIIDFVSFNKDKNIVLTISDHLLWDNKNEHLLILQDKINSYLTFIESEEFNENYPEATGRRIIINVAAKFHPNVEGELFLKKTDEILKSSGYSFSFAVVES